MVWNIRITEEVKKDYAKIEGSIQKQVLADIVKVSQAPLPSPHGYRKPLGNKNGNFFIFSKKRYAFYISFYK